MKIRPVSVKKNCKAFILTLLCLYVVKSYAQSPAMNEMWKGNATAKNLSSTRGKIFREGRYAMFIHWGLFSQLANKWNDKTYYGIGEWLMNKNMAGIPAAEYVKTTASFNPVNFNAKAIVQLAKDAGMKYIVITSKHHDGFDMFHSKATQFNVVDATPFKRDPMKELANACKEAGIGFGFYYSQNYDWTTPGGGDGPKTDVNGKPVSFEEYFNAKCLPDIEQITTEYGPLALVWFDTPGNIEKKYVDKLVETVHKNQPGAFVSGRVGHGLGDYSTLGDMEVPKKNVAGLWESVDVTNDSWGYAWYDENWKSPKDILTRTLSTIARGGNYMLNIGPKSDGTVPLPAALALRSSGNWIKKHPQIVYQGGRSPWQHALPWGDAITNGNKISLLVYNWPTTGKLYLPGSQSAVATVDILINGKRSALKYKKEQGWLIINVPPKAPEELISVIELTTTQVPKADDTLGIDPAQATLLDVLFASADQCTKDDEHWMEKFGEWKHVDRVHNWQANGSATWVVDVLKPGYYQSSLNYKGNGRLVWKIKTEEGMVQNQQNSSNVYTWYPLGWLHFSKPGRYHISVSLAEGDLKTASLMQVKLEPVAF